MPTISKIRFTNIIYEQGLKRFNDDIFDFEGKNAAIILENGGGKTVFVQTALQAVLPGYETSERKIRETLSLESNEAHIGIEWIIDEKPRRYLVTAVTLYIHNNKLESFKYVYEYGENEEDSLLKIPFTIENGNDNYRPAGKGEIQDYYQHMQSKRMNAKLFSKQKEYFDYIEANYKIIPSQWRSIGKINGEEGGVEKYFEECKTTAQLLERLLIPAVEEGLSERGNKDFINIFEKQRNSFKEHKNLREVIKQSQEVNKKIYDYVEVFKEYHQKKDEFIQVKKYAKAINQYLQEEEKEIKEDLRQNYIENQELDKQNINYEQKKDSFEIYRLELICNFYKKELETIESKYYDYESDIVKKKTLKENIEILKLKKQKSNIEEKISLKIKQRENLEKDVDLELIRYQIEENKSKIKGYFKAKEYSYIEEIEKKEIKKSELEKEYKAYKSEESKLEKEYSRLRSDNEKKIGKLEAYKENFNKLKNNITGFDINETPENQRIYWSRRIAELQTILSKGKMDKSKIESNIFLKKKLKNENELELNKLTSQETLLNEKLSTLKLKEEELLNKLKKLNKNWYSYDSFYSKEASIINYFENNLEFLRREKEDKLKEEQYSARYINDYEEMIDFISDPMILKWVKEWQSEFIFLETGIEYLKKIPNDIKNDNIEKNPIWISSIIVNKDELSNLKLKIEKFSEELTYPIYIMTSEEARSNLVSNKIYENICFPKHWQENLNQEDFLKWKEELKNKYKECKDIRRKKEEEINEIQEYQIAVNNFIEEYQHSTFKNLTISLKEIKDKIISLANLIQTINESISSFETEIKEIEKNTIEFQEEEQELNNKVRNIHQYIQDENKIRNLEKEINKNNRELEDIQNVIKKQENKSSKLKSEIKEIEELVKEMEKGIAILKNNHYYLLTKTNEPIVSNLDFEVLINEYEILDNQYNSRKGNIESIEERLKELEEDKNRTRILYENRIRDCKYNIDEKLKIEIYDSDIEDKLGVEIKKLEVELDNVKVEREKIKKEYDYKYNEIDIKKKLFYEKFSEIINFEESEEVISESLEKENKRINEAIRKNINLKSNLDRQNKEIESIQNKLDSINLIYNFKAEEIDIIYLDEKVCMDFKYKRNDYYDELIKQLKDVKKEYEEKEQYLNKYQENFKRECDNMITDPRLKSRTNLGIEQKKKLEEVIEWQRNMEKSINHVIEVSKEIMRNHDKDLVQYVNHLYSHLRTIIEELSMIPKKTRIKVDEKWKDIFEFQIPSWEEEEAKEEIKKYIDNMLEFLEKDKFKDDNGNEIVKNINDEIKKLLEIKQLLPVIMNNNQIKIRCKKVSNDKKISEKYTSWEESNKWSGGEKWSKNMTLFLGILNYVAEKSNGVENEKTYGTVILDNPFGKASSEHVLDPVFYVAEKLGFQIIALTAHSEGEFVRMYFPIIYSCILRKGEDNRTSIIDKAKEIKYILFEDKEFSLQYEK